MERFVSDICEGVHCFMCGASPDKVEFNDEHVIPRWILRKLDWFDQKITLPNNEKIKYSRYTVPCCVSCNSFLGREIEEGIREAVDGGLESVNKFIVNGGYWNVFLWLSLVFFKTHLKDSSLHKHLDRRKGTEKISDDYNWGFLHHIHCMVRAIQGGVHIQPECFGTLLVLPAKTAEHIENFDYRDVYAANTILLRVGEVAFLAVLDDSCAASNFFSDHSKRLTGALSPLQLREVISHLTLLNLKLKWRPRYYTKAIRGEFFICADLPEKMEINSHSREELGEIIFSNVSEYMEVVESGDLKFTKENVLSGNYHFLFDEKGRFINESMDLKKL
jgi:hypothetical protein|tara:strand:- start:1546 stop:2544 length:999 start_codon:yes stop_codon:yes gene_type:complete